MSFDKLTPELWGCVIGFLTPNSPKCLSGCTKEESTQAESDEGFAQLPSIKTHYVTTRSDVMPTELAVLMRTSRAFNQLASGPLYRRIITWNVKGLVDNLGNPPAHPDIESKDELLRRTRALHVEYCPKGRVPSYLDILSNPEHFFAVGCPTKLGTAVVQAAIEADHLRSTFHSLIGCNPFPKLATVAIGGVFGAQDDVWEEVYRLRDVVHAFANSDGEVWDTVDSSSGHFESLLQQSPLTHYCQRGICGPLSLPTFITWSNPTSAKPPSTSPLFTIHYASDPHPLPIALGHPTRWILEPEDRDKPMSELFETVARAMDSTLDDRKYVKSLEKTLNLEVYSSSHLISPYKAGEKPHFVPFAGEREITHEMQDSMRETWRKDNPNRDKDKVSWKASIDSPPCIACGMVYREQGCWAWGAQADEALKRRAEKVIGGAIDDDGTGEDGSVESGEQGLLVSRDDDEVVAL